MTPHEEGDQVNFTISKRHVTYYKWLSFSLHYCEWL